MHVQESMKNLEKFLQKPKMWKTLEACSSHIFGARAPGKKIHYRTMNIAFIWAHSQLNPSQKIFDKNFGHPLPGPLQPGLANSAVF